MAKATKSSAKEETEERILPLPQAVVEHHQLTLAPSTQDWRASGHVPPVLLFTGMPGIGKRSISYHLAQWLLCERAGFSRTAANDEDTGPSLFGDAFDAPEEKAGKTAAETDAGARDTAAYGDQPCGECASCRRALHGTWVDFTEILPESDGETEGRTLKVDQFRDLKLSQGFGAHEGGYRIILIPDADRMTLQAANSMLKLLEEPPRGWIFFLTASDPSLILPTVLSRCQQLRLRPFDEMGLTRLLIDTGATEERARFAARLAQGSWGRAQDLLQEDSREERASLLRILDDPGTSVTPLIEWGAGGDAAFDRLITQLESLCADLVRWSVTGQGADQYDWQNRDAARALAKQTQAAVRARGSLEQARGFWIARAESLMRARARSKAPLNRKLLLQDALIPWLEIR